MTAHIEVMAYEPCQYDLDFSYHYYSTDDIWNKNGKKISTYNDFKFREYQLYADVYVTDIDCIGLKGSYIQIEEELNGNSRGFSDSELTWTRFFHVDALHALATQVTAIIPSGSQIYNLRYGEFGGQLDLLYSGYYSYMNHTVFIDSLLGYRAYRGFPSDQIRGYFSAGSYIFSKLYIEASLDLQYGLFNGKSKFEYPLFLLNPNYRLLQGNIRVAYHIHENIYFTAGVFQHLWGQNVGTGRGFFVDGWLEF
jgi:hypothetical protein